MMSMTHISIGLATTLAITRPDKFQDYLPVIAGAAIGSIICDFDCRSTDEMKDALYGRIVALSLFVVSIVIDLIVRGKVFNSLFQHNVKLILVGLVIFIITSIFAIFSEHRSFSHSLLALVLYVGALLCISIPLVIPFLIGYISHILLDIMNKKPVMFLFPSDKGFCLNWFYAGKTANKVFLVFGCIGLLSVIVFNILY